MVQQCEDWGYWEGLGPVGWQQGGWAMWEQQMWPHSWVLGPGDLAVTETPRQHIASAGEREAGDLGEDRLGARGKKVQAAIACNKWEKPKKQHLQWDPEKKNREQATRKVQEEANCVRRKQGKGNDIRKAQPERRTRSHKNIWAW